MQTWIYRLPGLITFMNAFGLQVIEQPPDDSFTVFNFLDRSKRLLGKDA